LTEASRPVLRLTQPLSSVYVELKGPESELDLSPPSDAEITVLRDRDQVTYESETLRN
jgi:hypothetical protein